MPASLPSPRRGARGRHLHVALAAALVLLAATAPTRAADPLGVEVSWCGAAGCEIVFTFDHLMVDASPGDAAAVVPLTFDPPQAGELQWRGPRELVFTPAPGAMDWGHRIVANIEAAAALDGASLEGWSHMIRVPDLWIAGKVAGWPIARGQPRFVAVLNDFRAEIGPKPLLVLYDQPVDAAWVARHVSARDGLGADVPIRVGRPDQSRLAGLEDVAPETLLEVGFEALPPSGRRVVLTMPSRGPEGAVSRVDRKNLVVAGPLEVTGFAIDQQGPGGLAPIEPAVSVELTNRVSRAAFEAALRIEPEPESVHVSSAGRVVVLYLRLEPGAHYRVTLDDRLADAYGFHLKAPASFDISTRDREPRLSLPEGPQTLEPGQGLCLRTVNVSDVSGIFRAIDDPSELVLALANQGRCDAWSDVPGVRRELRLDIDAPLNHPSEEVLSLRDIRSRGAGCVGLRAKGRGSDGEGKTLEAVTLVQNGDLGISAKLYRGHLLAWVTGLSDAEPAGGAKVTLYDERALTLASARADDEGVATLVAEQAIGPDGPSRALYLVAERNDQLAVLTLARDRLSKAWQFGQRGAGAGVPPLDAAIFTDRGVYRPGETVMMEAIVRDLETGMETAGRTLDLRITDPRGKEVAHRQLFLDDLGTAEASLDLEHGAAVGRYRAVVALDGRTRSRSFRVEEYRVPTFGVDVDTAAERWTAGSTARATIAAAYTKGGALAQRDLRYRVTRRAETFRPAAFADYTFDPARGSAAEGEVAAGSARLDARGRYTVAFTPERPRLASPLAYEIEATVTDLDRQAYAGRLVRTLHPVSYYVGIGHPARSVMVAGDRLDVPVVAVEPGGSLREGVRVKVHLEVIEAHTAARLDRSRGSELINHDVRREVTRPCVVRTAARRPTCHFELSEPGRYRVRAVADSRSGVAVEAGYEVTVGGGDVIPWPRFTHERIGLRADRTRYRPGDVARVVVESPFRQATGLLTVERGAVIERRVFHITDDSPVLEIPIRESFAPNVYASVVLLQGRRHRERDASGYEPGAPTFKLGYVGLEVEPLDAELDVHVAVEDAAPEPGSPLSFTLDVRDRFGNPARGKATVMVVDEAVLALTGYRTPDPVRDIYARRPLAVRTAESRLELPQARRLRREPIFPGGGGGDWEEDAAAVGDGDVAPTPLDVRSFFESTAYWNADVPLDEDGRARVSFILPDDVTTYRVMAVVAGDRRYGSGEERVLVRKPLMVQPIVPRFLYPGDTLELGAMVANGTARDAEVEVQMRAEGLHLEPDAARATLKVPRGANLRVETPVRVVGRGEAVLTIVATSGEHRDAVEARVPILDPGMSRRVVRGLHVAGRGELDIELPAERLAGSTEVEVLVSTTMLGELKDAVEYLMQYPHGCIEQTTSRAYPLVMLEDLLPEMGITVDEEKLHALARAGVERILSFQTTSGGLSYWPGKDQPHAFATAFGLTALIEGKKHGYAVPDLALAKMADYLETTLRKGEITGEMPHGGMADADTRAFFVMSLGRLGRPQHGYIETLWRERAALTPFGLSFLAVAVQESGGDKGLLESILAEVRRAATERPVEAFYEGERGRGWGFDSPLRTHAGALLAFAGSAPASEMSPKLLNGLLARRQGGLWGNTQENVFGIMAVAALASAADARVGGGEAPFELSIADRDIPLQKMHADSPRMRSIRLGGDELGLAEGRAIRVPMRIVNRGPSPLYVTVRAAYEEALSPETSQPVTRGFEVSRRYLTVDGAPLQGRKVGLGDLVEVELEVKAEGTNHYVAIDDRLPAGLEPLNTALATTERVDLGELDPASAAGLAHLSHHEVRDSRVSFYADDLPPGSYRFAYVARATSPGEFLWPAATAEAMYDPDVVGRTRVARLGVARSR